MKSLYVRGFPSKPSPINTDLQDGNCPLYSIYDNISVAAIILLEMSWYSISILVLMKFPLLFLTAIIFTYGDVVLFLKSLNNVSEVYPPVCPAGVTILYVVNTTGRDFSPFSASPYFLLTLIPTPRTLFIF